MSLVKHKMPFFWRYGVYNTDGSRLDMAAGGFPLIAFVEKAFPDGNTGQVPVHAWADYWGVWLDYNFQNIVTDTTPFTKVNSDDTANYFLKPKYAANYLEKTWPRLFFKY